MAKVITMGDLNDGPYNKSEIALGAKAIKTDVLPFGIYNPFEEMAKRGLGTIAFRDWDILIKSWFRNRSFNKIFQPLSIGKRDIQ
jgi:hypothetical protein